MIEKQPREDFMSDFLTPGRRNLRQLAKACVKVCDGPAEGDEFDSLCQTAYANLLVVYMVLANTHRRAVAEKEEETLAAEKKAKTHKTAIGNVDTYTLNAKIEAFRKADPAAFAAAIKGYKEDKSEVSVNGEHLDDCPDCNGDGRINPDDGTGLVSCDNCDGSGQVCAICEQPATSCTCDAEEDE